MALGPVSGREGHNSAHRKEATEAGGCPVCPSCSLLPWGPGCKRGCCPNSLNFPLFVPPALERTLPASGASPRENLVLHPAFQNISESLEGSLIPQPTAVRFHIASCPGHQWPVLLTVPIPWLPSRLISSGSLPSPTVLCLALDKVCPMPEAHTDDSLHSTLKAHCHPMF